MNACASCFRHPASHMLQPLKVEYTLQRKATMTVHSARTGQPKAPYHPQGAHFTHHKVVAPFIHVIFVEPIRVRAFGQSKSACKHLEAQSLDLADFFRQGSNA